MPYEKANIRQVRVLPVQQRTSYIDIEQAAAELESHPPKLGKLAEPVAAIADAVRKARAHGGAVMMAYGAHLVKNGCAPLVNALVRSGWITHLATQGAGIIHDLEFAWMGRSSESVRDNAPTGRFGTWDETGRFINTALLAGGLDGLGFGESIGSLMSRGGCTLPDPDTLTAMIREQPDHPLTAARADMLRFILDHEPPLKLKFDSQWGKYSVTQNAFEQGVPLTVHPGIGYDIFNCHPMFHGAAIGRAAGIDFQVFARSVMNLTGGVYLSVGSAVMSPQVFEKAFSVANNLREHQGLPFIKDHHITVVDIADDGGWDWAKKKGEPPKDHPAYYLRWCKTFHRMGARFQYLQADNRTLLAGLAAALKPAD
ncbi:MAG: hypothetical protein GC159_00175 [Phycisphaera sp.]|nr:hypothetical protein [Phycisphaera sp.]